MELDQDLLLQPDTTDGHGREPGRPGAIRAAIHALACAAATCTVLLLVIVGARLLFA